eukprot:Lankesteria_metandrocarpae@DN9189_c0_g1_i1.p1
MAEMADTRSSLNIEPIEEVAADFGKFTRFCFLTGFSQGCVQLHTPPANNAADGLSADSQDDSKKLKMRVGGFRGWKVKESKNTHENRSRLTEFLESIAVDTATAHLVGPSSRSIVDDNEDLDNYHDAKACFSDSGDEFGSPMPMTIQVRDLGLLVGSVDAILRMGGRWGPPLHSGQRMFDDSVCVFEFEPSMKNLRPETLRRTFIKSVMVTLLRESRVPYVITDFRSRAIKLFPKIAKGIPVMSYENMALDGLQADLRSLCKKQLSNATEKTFNDAICRLKAFWVNPPHPLPRQYPNAKNPLIMPLVNNNPTSKPTAAVAAAAGGGGGGDSPLKFNTDDVKTSTDGTSSVAANLGGEGSTPKKRTVKNATGDTPSKRKKTTKAVADAEAQST